MKTRSMCLTLAAGAMLAAVPIARGADAVTDYSATSNPNGVWRYGYSNALASAFILYTHSSSMVTPPIHFWDDAFTGTPQVSKNLGSVPATVGSTVWGVNDVVLFPGVNAQYSIIRYTAPSTGVYNYSISFASADQVGGSRDVHVVINGTVMHSGTVIGPITSAIPVTFSGSVALTTGGTIDYVVGMNGDNNLNDGTMIRNAVVNKTITTFPGTPCRWKQPWTKPLASHLSVVQDCGGQQVSWAPIAMDDWLCKKGAKMNHLTWWGTNPTSDGVPQKRFFIRIWTSALATCAPFEIVFERCVDAHSLVAGTDCQGRRVFHYFAGLNPPFQATAGASYFLQISEVDADPTGVQTSPNPGLPDFAWSAHRDIQLCAAQQLDAAGNFITPLVDPCDNLNDDLAFTFSSRYIKIHFQPGVVGIPQVYLLGLWNANTGDFEDSVECLAFLDGSAEVETDVPDGSYIARLYGMASVGVEPPPPGGHGWVLADGMATDLGMVTMPLGDANNTGEVNFSDITEVLGRWLSAAPLIPYPR